MKKQHKLWLAMVLAMASSQASAAAITCDVTPRNWIITDGETMTLSAVCNGALASIDWRMDGVSVTGVTALQGHAAGDAVEFVTPVGLGATNSHNFTVVGVPASTSNTYGGSTTARVTVKPSSAVVAKAAGVTNPTVPQFPACGNARGATLSAMPTGTYACVFGSEKTMAIGGPRDGWSWSCESLTGGGVTSCYANYGSRCGPAAGVATAGIPSSARCAAGSTASGVTTTTTAYTWTCTAPLATAVSCSAPRK